MNYTATITSFVHIF